MTPADRASEPQDWATDLACTILAETAGAPYMAAQALLAAHLRYVRAEGESLGIARAQAAIVGGRIDASPEKLQRECQADMDEERAHGWAVP